jgi:hypothetical protein
VKDPPRLIPIEAAVLFVFDPEYPFSADDVDTGRPGNQFSGVVGDENIVLSLHGCPPVWVMECRMDRLENGRDGRRGGRDTRIAWIQFDGADARAGGHRMESRSAVDRRWCRSR